MQVFVINLASSPERRAHMTAELEKTGLDYEIVTGVDGRELDLNDSTLVAPTLLAKNDFPAGTAGCALSHRRVYQRILADGLDKALVLEDDVTLPADLGRVVDAVSPHLHGAEVALLEYGSPEICTLSREGSVALPCSRVLALPIDINQLMNAAAYVITRDACERMTAGGLPLQANADDWAFFYGESWLDRVRCVYPLTVTKSAQFESTIGFYSLGRGLKARIVAPLVHRKIPLLHQLVLYRRQRILRERSRTELVEAPFVDKPSRLD